MGASLGVIRVNVGSSLWALVFVGGTSSEGDLPDVRVSVPTLGPWELGTTCKCQK